MDEIKAIKPQQRSEKDKKELAKLRQRKHRIQSQDESFEVKKARQEKNTLNKQTQRKRETI